ncbi:DUF6338 family protein [Streptomyces sp. SID3212]|uniref:DUF6338 family protein n=1 Tax=Streptomyces sp. SID3212 TaxID=2690259 RepID=UPI001367C1F4|nr:DUF6338 family protein [Streptomyces sp. SID3212]MYV52518.1 hypothetical protein [Streptomyces sp. SID3212]
MGGAPSTIAQLALIVAVVLPGVTYQLVCEGQRGPSPSEKDLAERVLRALTASVALDSLYALLLAPWVVQLAENRLHITKDPSQVRLTALLCLLLIFVVPAITAWIVSWFEQHNRQGSYQKNTASAWDQLFQNCPASFVRARLKDGVWVGGWYGDNSFATGYPRPPEILLELCWRMSPDGAFIGPVDGTRGLFINGADIDILEIIENSN